MRRIGFVAFYCKNLCTFSFLSLFFPRIWHFQDFQQNAMFSQLCSIFLPLEVQNDVFFPVKFYSVFSIFDDSVELYFLSFLPSLTV